MLTPEQSLYPSPSSQGTSDLRASNATYNPASAKKPSGKKSPGDPNGMTPGSNDGADVNGTTAGEMSTAAKPRRVRTGCLTCRERHLKCDEAMPICQNCKKSNRACKRGVRLNFIDTQVQNPPYLLPPTHNWQINFQDDSREIASEYRGGVEKYAALKNDLKPDHFSLRTDMAYDYGDAMGAPTMSHQPLPPIGGILPAYPETTQGAYGQANTESYHDHSHTNSTSTFTETLPTSQSCYNDQIPGVNPGEDQPRPFLETADEVLYMQVFVEEVGLWMDSMDAKKHFSRKLPFQALREPMLLNAFLACGARHLNLVNSAYTEEKAMHYYNAATQYLLRSLQNPERDSIICATTAVILNVYEIMSEKALQRMNHIAGARALIKECGWNARSTGIGGACFWLNVGMELLSCLHFNWQVAWEPDDWGIDMTMNPEQQDDQEEQWTYKMLYIMAKIANFRSSAPRFQEASAQAEQLRLNQRIHTWQHLKEMCDRWHDCIPETMHPMGVLPPYMTASKSSFPEVWLIKRTTVVARLFYHTAMALLGGTHPAAAMDHQLADDMHNMKITHSRQICGIVAHGKDRGVASVSIRCLAIAAECLVVRREQEEVLEIFNKIKKETGWRVSFLHGELTEKWGWNNQQDDLQQQQMAMMGGSNFFQNGTTMPPVPAAPAPRRPQVPSGIINPLYATADFSAPNHPYQAYYVAPTPNHLLHTHSAYNFGGI